MSLSAVPAHSIEHVFPPSPHQAGGRSETVSLSVSPLAGGLRRYQLASTQPQREGHAQQRTVDEQPGGLRLRSDGGLFDALFAQAVDDARLLAVAQIRDGAYNGGAPITASVFQTGEFWTYVWTRDLAYAAHLGLAAVDPQRVVRSLLFKTSGWRGGVAAPPWLPPGSTQLVQDTGSGGSWPVSTDRVSWAWAAEASLDALPPAERAPLADAAWAALRGTVEADRLGSFDAERGLYGGEQSFLDWRVQTYAPWIVRDLVPMAASHALSTNVGHHQALRLLARLASERGEAALAARYAGWAQALAAAIHQAFWLPGQQQYASMTRHDGAPQPQVDMLGTALVVLSGIAPAAQAREALARYPHAPFGVPVIAPQQPGVPVYHNRAIWPFVSAYALRAAVQVDNPVLAQHAIDSLHRAAALHLSNMENLEWLTATAQHDDGPVINSRRQLWSVGAYLGMVLHTVFGLRPGADGLQVAPYLTPATRRLLGTGPQAQLLGWHHQGRPLEVLMHLPPPTDATEATGVWTLAGLTLNGQAVSGPIRAEQLAAPHNRLDLHFGPLRPAADVRITAVPAEVPSLSRDDPRVFAPPAPQPLLRREAGRLQLALPPLAPAGAHYSVHRNGRLAEAAVPAGRWADPLPPVAGQRRCYGVSVVSAQGHSSQPAPPLCDDGAQGEAQQFIAVADPRVRGAGPVTPPGDGVALATLRHWGAPADVLQIDELLLDQPGRYAFTLRYHQCHQDIQTGVTATVKRLRLLDSQGQERAVRLLALPNVQPEGGQWPARESTALVATLPAGRYRLVLDEGFNMSYLASNASYSGAGGAAGPLNRTHLAGVSITRLASLPD